MNPSGGPCDQLVPYFLKEMTEPEREAFDQHLSACPSCQMELKELNEAWNALPYAMEELEPPAEWKGEILAAAMRAGDTREAVDEATREFGGAGEGAIADRSSSDSSRRRVPAPARPRRTYAIAAMLAAMLIVGSAGWYGATQWGGPAPGGPPSLSEPSQVVGRYSLRSFDAASPSASGVASLMQHGDNLQLVLQASGLPALQGEQAYQVWIVKSGNRVNGGTFRVDSLGNGVLTFTFGAGVGRDFDTIGITLEPDPEGTQPRGKKVLGT